MTIQIKSNANPPEKFLQYELLEKSLTKFIKILEPVLSHVGHPNDGCLVKPKMTLVKWLQFDLVMAVVALTMVFGLYLCHFFFGNLHKRGSGHGKITPNLLRAKASPFTTFPLPHVVLFLAMTYIAIISSV